MVGDVDDGQLAGMGRTDDLYRTLVDRRERGPQRFVTLDERVERALQRVGMQRAVEPPDDGDVVRPWSGLELVEQPESLLRERQGDVAVATTWNDGAHVAAHPCGPLELDRQ